MAKVLHHIFAMSVRKSFSEELSYSKPFLKLYKYEKVNLLL